jgi:hypothetical protein
VKDENKTVDFATEYRCMLVGLDEATAKACQRAVRPLTAVIVPDIAAASAKISEVLPLVLALPQGGPKAGLPDLLELAGACGAELVTIALPLDVQALGEQILEAIRRSEGRRVQR